jgi:hypothetical protein
MNRLTKIDAYVAVWGLIATGVTALVGGTGMILSALIGAVLASINWLVFRALAVRLAASPQRLALGLLLGTKTAVLLGGIALILTYLPLSPIALLAGMSGLFLGIVTSTLTHSMQQAESPVERKL